MNEKQIRAQLTALWRRRSAALEALVVPARAAANQMTDAGMKAGADPLKAALFEYDAVCSEVFGLVTADPQIFVMILQDLAKGERNG